MCETIINLTLPCKQGEMRWILVFVNSLLYVLEFSFEWKSVFTIDTVIYIL